MGNQLVVGDFSVQAPRLLIRTYRSLNERLERTQSLKQLCDKRVRLTRSFGAGGRLLTYNPHSAFNDHILYHLSKHNNMSKQQAIFSTPNAKTTRLYLLTSQSLFKIRVANYSIRWVFNLQSIRSVTVVEENSLQINLATGQEKRLKMV